MRKYELVGVQKSYSYDGNVRLGEIPAPPMIYWTLTFQREAGDIGTENLTFHTANKFHINRFLVGQEYQVHEIVSNLE